MYPVTVISKYMKSKMSFPLYFIEKQILQFSNNYILISKYMKFTMLFSVSPVQSTITFSYNLIQVALAYKYMKTACYFQQSTSNIFA